MPTRRAIAVSSLALALTAGCDFLGGRRKPPTYPLDRTADDAAQRALADLVKLVTPQNFALFGFKSMAELQSAKLDTPLEVFDIPLGRLRAYSPAVPVESLLTPSRTTFYPVSAMGDVRSSVSVLHAQTGYRPSELGASAVAQAVAACNPPATGAEQFIVRVQSVGVTLLGRRQGGVLHLVPLFAQPDLGFPVGQEQPAAQVVTNMLPLARQANGKPG